MSQYAFSGNTIINQSFPNTRTALNAAYAALASNSSGDNDPTSVAGGSLATVQHQWWYDSTNNKLMLRNDANNAWVEIATIDETSGNVLSITTQGLTIGATALTATGTEINQLSTITRGSILYGNASGATARLAKGGAGTVLTSDGTDISWAAASGGGGGSLVFIASTGAISNAGSVQFRAQDGHFDDTKYDHYQFWFQNVIPATDAVYLLAQTSTNDGGAYATTNGDYHDTDGADDSIGIKCSNLRLGSEANEFGISGMFNLFAPHNTSTYTSGLGTTVSGASVGNYYARNTGGTRLAVEEVDALRFIMESGNIESGEIVMYGISNS